jgi:hypothetical protein
MELAGVLYDAASSELKKSQIQIRLKYLTELTKSKAKVLPITG